VTGGSGGLRRRVRSGYRGCQDGQGGKCDRQSCDKRSRARSTRLASVVALALAAPAALSCGSETVRQGQASSYLVISALEAANGAEGDSPKFSGVLHSDVITFVEDKSPIVFTDPGRVRMRLAMKDVTNPNVPTDNNAVTLTRYRVDFRRSDGRNAPGVDVPFGYDGAATFTISGGEEVEFAFTLIRLQTKLEPPLIGLRGAAGAITISTLADVTFFGRDQTGREVSVSGSISVNFADWDDPN
jgi:hypothetical protein